MDGGWEGGIVVFEQFVATDLNDSTRTMRSSNMCVLVLLVGIL